MNKTVAYLFGTIIAVSAIAGPAHAFAPGACKDDVKKFCGDVKPGGGAIQDCMKSHQADLSQACKDNITEMKAKMEQKKKDIEVACSQDIKQYCSSVTPGEGREFACLKSYSDKISAGCKAMLPKPGMRRGMHKDMSRQDQNSGNTGDANPVPPEPDAR